MLKAAEGFEQDLLRFARGDPVEVRPCTRIERFLRRIRRHPVRAAIFTSVTALVVACAFLAYCLNVERRASRRAIYDAMVVSAAVRLFCGELSLYNGSLGPKSPVSSTFCLRFVQERSLTIVRNSVGELRRAAAWIPGRPEARYHLARGLLLLDREGDAGEAVRLLEGLVRDGFPPARVLLAEVDPEAKVARAGELRAPWDVWVRARRRRTGRSWCFAPTA